MKKIGHADLPLHYGTVPKWLSERMSQLGTLIIESLIYNFGKKEVLNRLSDPLWFQSLGAVLGMDWHSSGITTSVMGALKKGLNKISKDTGIFICGGRGKYSRNTPNELLTISDRLGINGDNLVKASKLCAKIDNTAIQDGFQLYLHNFILTDEGDWAIVQQGMNTNNKMARRYHWNSNNITSYFNNPHSGVVGRNQGLILNLAHSEAEVTREKLLTISNENPDKIISEYRQIIMPRHHEVKEKDVNLKRLGAVLATAYQNHNDNFENLLLTYGLGPRTIQSLTLISEVIYGTKSRFSDPARYSFAHGGKDGHPFPVPLKVYDRSISVLKESIDKSKLGISDKNNMIKKLYNISTTIEKYFNPIAHFDKVIEKEKKESNYYDGKTVFD